MSLRLKIWSILALVMCIVSVIAFLAQYQIIETDAENRLHQQAMDLRATLMATRRVYHKQFVDSGVVLDEKTLGFLPAHAMTRIAQEFSNWSQSGVYFNNVSDRPRNPANLADAEALAAMAWFRANPRAEEYINTLVDAQGRRFFHFAAPIWTEPYCLNCHSAPATSPPAIRQRYSEGYGYQVGDLRGVMSIRIPYDIAREAALAHWHSQVLWLAFMLLALLVSLGLLLDRYVTRRLQPLAAASQRIAKADYGVRVEDVRKDEIGALASGFNAMAEAIDQREAALHESQSSYRILAEYSWNWDYWIGADGVYRYVSPVCEQITGHPPSEFIADPGLFERLLFVEDQEIWRQHLADHLAHPQQYPHAYLTLRIRGADGGYRWIEHTCLPVFDSDGKCLGRRGVNMDMTERKRVEELEHYGAFQSGIAEMSTTVLHNIGNAITAVTQDAETIDHAGSELVRVALLLENNANHSRTELAGDNPAAAEVARRQCAIQLEAAGAIQRLSERTLRPRARALGESVGHIADIIRIQQSVARPNGQLSSFSLLRAIQSALDMQGDAFEKRGIVVEIKVDPGIDLVTLPHNHLLQSLVNAIRNSVEAIDARLHDAAYQGNLIVQAARLGDDRLRITLQDNGIGVDPAVRDKLFQFGFSTKERGSGFGLHSVAMFAQQVGGSVVLESDGIRSGARLVLELPLRFGHRELETTGQ